MSVRVHPMSADVVVTVADVVAPVERPLLNRIETVWSAQRARRPELFDGTLFACDRFDNEDGTVRRLVGHFVPYSWYVAARADREIAAGLGLRVVGVSAIFRCRDGIVVGRRASTTSESGLLELVPSGAVDTDARRGESVDLRATVLTELREELGLQERELDVAPVPFALVEDDESLLLEAGFRMSTALSFEEVERAQAALTEREHDHLDVLTADSAAVITAPRFSATSAALLRCAGLP